MKKNQKADARRIREAPLLTRTDLGEAATADIAGPMNAILADVFAIYLKTKNFHWHMSGPTSAITACSWTSRLTSCTR